MRFAHLSDIHLGFQKQEKLQKIEQHAFERAVSKCIDCGVDFVLIPGDLFHVNIPEMRVQKFAFAGFRRLYEAKIPVYVVYGSHDFSPVSNSVIDLLAEIGYITKVTHATSNDNGTISLDFLTDAKTGVKITGLTGLKVGRDRDWYEVLDRQSLESEPGFKIFLFHGGIADMKNNKIMDGDHMPISFLPKGFSYYAGGHMHVYNYKEFADYPHVVYPGTLFAGHAADLEENAKGCSRGLVLVDFEEKVNKVEFVPMDNSLYGIIEIDANNCKSESVNMELQKEIDRIDPAEKIVIVKIRGELMSGKTSDVDITLASESLSKSGAISVNISKNQLTSREYTITDAKGKNKDEIETNMLKENIGQLRNLSQKILVGDQGISLAKQLFHVLGQNQLDNEKKEEYSKRITDGALAMLGVKMDDS